MFGVRWQHLIGLALGGLLGLAVAGLASSLGFALALDDGLFWGAVVGGILAGVPQFAQSGAILSKSDDRVWNALLGFVGGLLFLGAFIGLVILVLGLLF